MRFLICGIGSIGQRHYRNLTHLGHEVALLRSRSGATPFINQFFDAERQAGRTIRVFYDMEDARRQFAPDAALITNPNALHAETAMAAARAGCHLFIEKPVAHTLESALALHGVAARQSLVAMVGYNLRFHPLLARMKELCAQGAIGAAIAVRAEVGEYIADWHPWEDYRTTYAPYRSGGGGVVLCFSHDIDYLYWLFGMPSSIAAVGGKITPLMGDAEDLVQVLFRFGDLPIASLCMDYWQRPPRRRCEIIGSDGTLRWDYYSNELIREARDGTRTRWETPPTFDRNDMFVAEIQQFIRAVNGEEAPAISLEQGIDVLRIATDIKRAIGL